MSDKQSILLAEDDSSLSNVIATWLENSGFSVHTVPSGSHAELELTSNKYDLVILDLGLPGMEGLEVLQRTRTRKDEIPIVIITARDSLTSKIAGLNAGADDYVTKPFELAELEARIRALLRRRSSQSERYLSLGSLRIDRQLRSASVEGDELMLSPTEYELLDILTLSAGQVVKRSIIIEKLSQSSEPLSENAVEVYIHRLRKKLDSCPIQLKTIRGIGYSLNLS